MSVEVVVLSLSFLILLVVAWYLICNNWTRNDRIRYLDNIYGLEANQRRPAMQTYDSVSYDQHFWYRLTLRDPNKLYDQTQ